MGRVVVLSLLVLLVAGCGSDSEADDDLSEPTNGGEGLSIELACEQFTAIHADIDPSFEGHETVEEALSAWQGLPNGEWTEHEDGTWLLVNSDGDTVGRSTELLMINAERYVSAGVEYCE